MKKIILMTALAVIFSGCAGTQEAPEGDDSLAPATEQDKAAAVAPKVKPTNCGVSFDLNRAGWFVAKGWPEPFNEVSGYKLFISRYPGGPYCAIKKDIFEERLVIRGLEEDQIYYLVMQSIRTDGKVSKPSPEWANRAVRREYHLPRSVEKYPTDEKK
jgi:hypothetical protein